MVLQAVALQAHGEQDKAVHLLCDALALAEPGGFIRLFVAWFMRPVKNNKTPSAAHLPAGISLRIAGCATR
jgi:LuxR family maltose regulon positive regulatory protein